MTGNLIEEQNLKYMPNSMNRRLIFLAATLSSFIVSCTPIKTSPKDEKHQMELTLHEVQTNVDDFRHDLNCFKTDLQILEGKIRNQENQVESVKQNHIAQTLTKIDSLSEKIKTVDSKIEQMGKKQEAEFTDIEKLSLYAKEVNSSLSQYKDKLSELEGNVIVQSKRFEEVKKLKETLEAIATSLKINNDGFYSYKVRAGDSLDKIARVNKTTVDILKKANNLDQDLIVIGQELKIPK